MKRTLLLILCLASLSASAANTDSLRVSVLTVMPRPNYVYTVFGHTALRLHDPSQKLDVVFNWGTFDFNAPHFIYRFVRGETDYFLSYSGYQEFIYSYAYSHAAVVEQTLNLPAESKVRLRQLIADNLKRPVYRYNFLFDNCTSRVRDLIEQSRADSLIYPSQTEPTTFRQLIHSCTKPYPWLEFGIDLLIGAGADKPIGLREEQFLPLKLKQSFDGARWADGTKLVASEQQVLEAGKMETPTGWATPGNIGILLSCFALACLLFVKQPRQRYGKLFCALLFLAAGLAGCLVAFVTFFSEHPCTSPNWNLLWLHPLHLLAVASFFVPMRKSAWNDVFAGYHGLNIVVLLATLATMAWLPQRLNPAVLSYMIALLLASIYWIWIYFRTFAPAKTK